MKVSSRRSFMTGLAALAAMPLVQVVQARVPPTDEGTDEGIVRELYRVAEPASLDADRFVSLFASDGYFLDVPSGQQWIGPNVREPVTGLISAYPDIHRELLRFVTDDEGTVVVELRLQGTHRGDLPLPDGILRATGKTFDVRCCDVWQLEDGKVKSFHCYNSLVAFLKS